MTHTKPLWDFDIQMDHLISARRPDLIIINKKKKKKKKKERKKERRKLPKLWTLLSRVTSEWNWKKVKRLISTSTLVGNWKNLWNMKVTIIQNRDWCFWYSHKKIIIGTGWLERGRTSGDHPNGNIIENDQNTEKSPGDLRRLAVTQTSVKTHQLMLRWKTLKE